MRILIAVDGSPCSNAAVTEVCRLHWPAGSEVRVISVEGPLEPPLVRGSAPTIYDEIVQQQHHESAHLLKDVAEMLTKRQPALRVSTALSKGWPKDAIVSEAERWRADLVVVGSHGYGPIRRFFLGSVSLFVAHNAPCSVMIVRTPSQLPAADKGHISDNR